MSSASCVLSNLSNPLLNGLSLGLACSEDGQVRQDLWDRATQPVMGLGDTLGAAIAALLANGQEPPVGSDRPKVRTMGGVSLGMSVAARKSDQARGARCAVRSIMRLY